MSKRIEVIKSPSRTERIRVTIGSVALGAAVVGAAVGIASHEAHQPKTEPETVTVHFGADTPTLYDAARELRQQGATEDVQTLVSELKAAEPGHDGVVHEGDTATVKVDIMADQGNPGAPDAG